MITRLKLKPGQKGTKKLAAEYGDALVCVRYRYDRASCMRAKTVEIIVEKTAWYPDKRLWSIPYGKIKGTALENIRCQKPSI
jgi:hypothetical protein